MQTEQTTYKHALKQGSIGQAKTEGGRDDSGDEPSDEDVSAPEVDEPELTCAAIVGGMGRGLSCATSILGSPGATRRGGVDRMPRSLRNRSEQWPSDTCSAQDISEIIRWLRRVQPGDEHRDIPLLS